MSAEVELQKIRQNLDVLTNLYVKLIDRLLPEEEPDEGDIQSIRDDDEIAGEEELLRALEE